MTGLSSAEGLQSLWRLLREMGCVCVQEVGWGIA